MCIIKYLMYILDTRYIDDIYLHGLDVTIV